MSTLDNLYDVYEQLLNLGFIKPMIVRHYNNEYILVHIFSDNDVDMCKIVKSANDDTLFTILVTNFQKDGVDCFEGDPVAFITDRFIEANGLDKLDIDALAGVIRRTCNDMIVKSVIATSAYTILCKSFKIAIDVTDGMFKVLFYADNYNGPIYKFKTGFEAFKFIYYIKRSRINQFSYNKTITPLLKLSMDLYLKFGDNAINQITTLPGESINNTVVKMQNKNGYMAFSIDTLDDKNVIECEIYRYDNKVSGRFKAIEYEDILDFIDREYELIK